MASSKLDDGDASKLGSVHYTVALDILAYLLIPFLEQHRDGFQGVIAHDVDVRTPGGIAHLQTTMRKQLEVPPGQMTEAQRTAGLSYASALKKLAFFRIIMVCHLLKTVCCCACLAMSCH
jgi:hypothetical protein